MKVRDVYLGTGARRNNLQVAKTGDAKGTMKSGVVEIRTRVRAGEKVI